MTAEERMRERAAQVCDEAHAFDANERGGKHGVAHGLASEIRALPLEGEPQGEPAPTREWNAEVTARNVADGAESADLIAPSRVRAMAIEFERLRALNRKLAKDVIALATENDRLRAENAELRAECAIRNDEVSGLIGMNADLRREREGMVPVSKKLMDSTISTLQEHGEHAIALNLWAALIAAKDKP